MSHFAELDENNVVKRVLVIEQEMINTGAFGDPKNWVQTSYNTKAGKHLLGGTPLRKNYAGIGYAYDKQRDAFIPPKIFNSWIINKETCQWEAPIKKPQDGKFYKWDESVINWVEDK